MAKVAVSADIQDLRGKIGTNVFTRARNGATVRIRVQVKNPRTTAQTTVRANFARAASTFKGLTTAEVSAWAAYADTITKVDPVSGQTYSPSAMTAFCGLASKFLQINPGGTIPTTPPASSFPGDAVTVTAQAAAGQVNFTGSAGNAANVRTELLLQPLKSQNRTPAPEGYRSKAFVGFTPGSLLFPISVPAGFYAPAYRFVDALTGQETPLITLPVVQVS